MHIQNNQGTVFTGIGRIGFRKRFDCQNVKSICIREQWSNNEQKSFILIETREGKLIKFGSMLRADRRKFIASAAQQTIVR